MANRLSVPATVLAAYKANKDFQEALAGGGVTPALMDGLAALLETAVTAEDARAAAAQAAGVASEALKAAVEGAETAFVEVSKRGVAAGKRDPAVRAALDVGRRAKSRPQRLLQMRQYLNAADGQRAALDGYGLTDAHVEAARATLGAAEEAAKAWATLDKVAEDATRLRTGAMEPLDAAMRDLQERGRAGASDRPDFLELLGLPPG